jgi:hypothetical protein
MLCLPLALCPRPALCGEKRSLAAKPSYFSLLASSLEQSKPSASASSGLVFVRNASIMKIVVTTLQLVAYYCSHSGVPGQG